MHHLIADRGRVESRVIKIHYGIINVEVRGIFVIGCFNYYRGLSGLKRLFGR